MPFIAIADGREKLRTRRVARIYIHHPLPLVGLTPLRKDRTPAKLRFNASAQPLPFVQLPVEFCERLAEFVRWGATRASPSPAKLDSKVPPLGKPLSPYCGRRCSRGPTIPTTPVARRTIDTGSDTAVG